MIYTFHYICMYGIDKQLPLLRRFVAEYCIDIFLLFTVFSSSFFVVVAISVRANYSPLFLCDVLFLFKSLERETRNISSYYYYYYAFFVARMFFLSVALCVCFALFLCFNIWHDYSFGLIKIYQLVIWYTWIMGEKIIKTTATLD